MAGLTAVQHSSPSYNYSTSPSLSSRPKKRPMPTPRQTIAVVNSSGRQAASFIRVASAVGYKVRAQLRNLDGIVASEISSLPNVTVIVGDLYTKPSPTSSASPTLGPSDVGVNHDLIKDLYRGCQLAFINTTFWGDEVAIGKALADAAVTAGIQHYIYSTMPNHHLRDPSWPSLPLWSSKYTIETYIRSLPTLLPKTTFLYTGIYNNNFTSLPYPLFCMELQQDGSFAWTAPFHPDVPLPWLDAEHDVGPAVLQIFKDSTSRWGNGERIALAYEMLSPRQACKAFSSGVGRPVRYKFQSKIDVKVKIPNGYREQLLGLEKMYAIGREDPKKQPLYFGEQKLEDSCPDEAMALWEGYRGLEEYAREVFPLEEAANGLTWMNEDGETDGEEGAVEQDGERDGEKDQDAEEDDDDNEEGLVMGGGLHSGTGTGGENTPARKEESWLA
ncbi:NmrA-domain-containing protein [Acephala macrosclerotiorum]|nr:NmrA-domain-containing protein [Acephala macrosclerotiorum]